MSTNSINHVGYEDLRARPIVASIETKTESRTVEEAKAQLGMRVASQVARIEALARELATLGAKNPAAEARSGIMEKEMVSRGRRKSRGRGGRISQPHTQEPTPPPIFVIVRILLIFFHGLCFHSSMSIPKRGHASSLGLRP